jgi:hypothetical protein
MDAQVVARAFEIGIQLAGLLAKPIAELLESGATEEEATREALKRLAAQPDLVPVLPKVRAMIAEARAKAVEP